MQINKYPLETQTECRRPTASRNGFLFSLVIKCIHFHLPNYAAIVVRTVYLFASRACLPIPIVGLRTTDYGLLVGMCGTRSADLTLQYK